MNHFKTALAIGIAVVLVTACGLGPLSDSGLVQSRGAAGGTLDDHEGYVEVTGVIGPGALYSLLRPDEWNGDLN